MGLFDFLKRKPEPPPAVEGPSPDYAFAHYALRQMALSDPLRFLAVMASPDAHRFLDALLDDVAEQCGRKPSFDAQSITIHPTRVASFPCAIIRLPEPKEMAEAFMVAVIVPIDPSSTSLPASDTIKGRYFTLEKGFTLSNEPRTVLGEWDAQMHSNYGNGPAPTVEAFAAALTKLMSRDATS